jgi:beta-catenin-like protein 1
MPDNPTPDMLKKMKMDVVSPETPISTTTSDSNINVPKPKRKATVEEVDDMDVDRERNFAPGGDADYFTEEDDEGRFFGGGLTLEQKEILNIFEDAGGEGVPEDVSLRLIMGDVLIGC